MIKLGKMTVEIVFAYPDDLCDADRAAEVVMESVIRDSSVIMMADIKGDAVTMDDAEISNLIAEFDAGIGVIV